MFIHITITQKNVKVFPVHSHDTWEYICYEEGEGVLKTEKGNIPFKPGTVICVPPNCKHGSKSENHFKNICIHTNIAITDNQRVHLPLASKEVRRLFNVIGNLYREKDKYMSVIEMLLPALKDLILKETELSVESGSISFVHNEITKNFMDTEFDLKKLVKHSGYVDDVLRVKFKGVYGVTPKEYLDNLRLELAKDYLRIYGNILSIKEISEMCGFNDSLYFSRRFKREFSINPSDYIKKKAKKKV
jgi:AraC-like DNA-binding protein